MNVFLRPSKHLRYFTAPIYVRWGTRKRDVGPRVGARMHKRKCVWLVFSTISSNFHTNTANKPALVVCLNEAAAQVGRPVTKWRRQTNKIKEKRTQTTSINLITNQPTWFPTQCARGADLEGSLGHQEFEDGDTARSKRG